LQKLYDNEWLSLVAVDPEERMCYRYVPKLGWKPIASQDSARESKPV
jgi:hypothetical protein